MGFRRFLYLLFFTFGSYPALSQIVDDSTKEIYGLHSTKYFRQQDLFQGNEEKRILDTSINYLHYYNYQYTKDAIYQGLGNMGMAMKPIYYKAPEEIGYRLGFEAFHPYLHLQKNQRYYDTKSPYTELSYLQGSTGEQRLFLLFTRNVNRYWNLGGSYNRFTSSKQLNVVAPRDFQADHHQLNFFSSVKTNKSKYVALADFNYMQHWSYESGGVKPVKFSGPIIDSGMFLYKYARVSLDKNGSTTYSSANAAAARNYYKTLRAHLYHQFNPLDSGQNLIHIFHEFDWQRETQYFRDNDMRVDSSYRLFYKEIDFKDTSKAFYQYDYELLQNKVGIKGFSEHFYYSLFYKMRNYSLVDHSQDSTTIGKSKIRFQDAFVGGSFGYRWSHDFSFQLNAQQMLSFRLNEHPDDRYYKSHQDYQANLTTRYKNWQVEVAQSRVSPTLMQTRLISNLASWAKDSMNAVVSSNAGLSYSYAKGDRFLKIGLMYQRIDHLVYFARDTTSGSADYSKIRPIQDAGYVDYIQPTLGFRTNWRWLYFENDLILTHILNNRPIIHMPGWFTMPKLYYQNNLFKKATLVQAGIELFLRESYYADYYAPQINQFYWQDKSLVNTFPILNVFVNAKIRQVRVFLKVSNIFGDMNFPNQTGYLDTPYYPGMRRSFQFGFIWKAFD